MVFGGKVHPAFCRNHASMFHYRCNVFRCNTVGRRVQGSTNQPQINGFYTRSDLTENGFPVYTKHDKVMYWHGTNGGQWNIADAIGSGCRASNTSPDDGADGPSTSGWKTWDGNQWALESTLHVTGRPAKTQLSVFLPFFCKRLVSHISHFIAWFLQRWGFAGSVG